MESGCSGKMYEGSREDAVTTWTSQCPKSWEIANRIGESHAKANENKAALIQHVYKQPEFVNQVGLPNSRTASDARPKHQYLKSPFSIYHWIQTVELCGDCGNLIASSSSTSVEYQFNSSIKTFSRIAKPNFGQGSVTEMENAQNILNYQSYYRQTLNDPTFPYAKKNVVPAVQDVLGDHVADTVGEPRHHRWLNPRKYAPLQIV